ncbi:MAG: hypothetical protein P1V20_29925, partial [Verrucomicrobiales bacterium]|nr:hypothetical protein [Verrucomicrobiales bacterium]
LQNQADRFLVDADGKSAAQYAKDGANQNIHRLFAEEKQGPTLKDEKTIVNTPAPGDGTAKPLVALNGSTIRTSNSKIHALTYFQLDEYAERTLPVTLKDVDGVYAVLTRMDPTGIPADIKIAKGERIPGTPFRLQSIEPQKVRSNGLPESTLDTARVRIQNLKTGANHLLVRNETSEPIDSYAILTADNSSYRYVAKTGDIFQTVDTNQEEKDYQVVAIEETNVAFKDLTNAKIFTVKKRRHL